MAVHVAEKSSMQEPSTQVSSLDTPAAGDAVGRALTLAIALSLGSAVALGMARFSYALLLPAMKTDLAWSFAQAGAMNTANALGYLLGALCFPRLTRRWTPAALLIAGCVTTAALMAASGIVFSTNALLAMRIGAGIGSALVFISGGVLAAQLASLTTRGAGLLIGVYYGGTGWGIVASSLLVPVTVLPGLHGWKYAWFALAALCALCALGTGWAARRIETGHARHARQSHAHAAPADGDTSVWRIAFALAGYGLFGVGYIGYMTFIVALLRNGGMSASAVSGFYILLGIATIGSARLWSSLLDRMRGGQALAVFNTLLGAATLVPALIVHPVAAFVSGAIFGATFLSAVASTTAFVRHNLPAHRWAKGISAFTIVFALGQIAGPVVIGWVADSAGLARGMIWSAAVLLAGAALAACQRPLSARA
jgi:predicted MFS family arabinose efflux permease